MSSSSGNTVGPIEALRLVPPEILRFLVANSKPSKAIEFDTGMGLVNLADEYERLCARDLAGEMEAENLSRRKRVQLEDAMVALDLSVVHEDQDSVATSVSFRHLSLLAQVKPEDEAVWDSLRSTGSIDQPTEALKDRLIRMRSWIASEHFPDEMRITLLEAPSAAALNELTVDQRKVLVALETNLRSADWTAEGITEAFKSTATEAAVSMRDVYRASYALFMGTERGPRLAPILANCDRETMVELVRRSQVV